MLSTDQLEIATIERKSAFDVEAFRYCNNQSVYKGEVGIGVLLEDLRGAQVVFLKESLQNQFGRCKTRGLSKHR
jgi:hypothetical protein